MANSPKRGEPSRIIESVSRFAGALVGTAVTAGRRIARSTIPSGSKPPVAGRKKEVPAQAEGKNYAAKSPVKKKKTAASGKKTRRRTKKKTAKNKMSGHSQPCRTSQTRAGPNAPIAGQDAAAKARMADEKSRSVNRP